MNILYRNLKKDLTGVGTQMTHNHLSPELWLGNGQLLYTLDSQGKVEMVVGQDENACPVLTQEILSHLLVRKEMGELFVTTRWAYDMRR